MTAIAQPSREDQRMDDLVTRLTVIAEDTGTGTAYQATIREAVAALAASTARIETLTEALHEISVRYVAKGEDPQDIINELRDTARAALDAAPRSGKDPSSQDDLRNAMEDHAFARLFDGLSVEDARAFRDIALLAIVEAHNWWLRKHMANEPPSARTIDAEVK